MIELSTSLTFDEWLAGLTDATAQSRIATRVARIGIGLFGDVKSVGGRVTEARIDYGPGYRLYYTRRGDEIVVLLCGGTKASQARDIKTAQSMVLDL